MIRPTALALPVIVLSIVACDSNHSRTDKGERPPQSSSNQQPSPLEATPSPTPRIDPTFAPQSMADGILTCQRLGDLIKDCKLTSEKEVAPKQEKFSRFEINYRTKCYQIGWGISLMSDEQTLPLKPSTGDGSLRAVLFGLGPVTFFDDDPEMTLARAYPADCEIVIESVKVSAIPDV